MKIHLFFLLCTLFLACCAVQREDADATRSSRQQSQKFEPTPDSSRQALARGQASEYAAAMEAFALEKEKTGRLLQASIAFSRASSTAGQTGQLQKAIAYATRAFELAEIAKDSHLQIGAIIALASAYRRVGQPQKAEEWLEKARVIVERIKPGESKDLLEARLYRTLGENYLRQGETRQTIDYLSHSITVWDARLRYLNSGAAVNTRDRQGAIRAANENIATVLHRLGDAYLQSANPQEAAKALERGIAILTASGLRAGIESSLYMSLGQVYQAQKNFAQATNAFNTAVQLAEARGQTSQLQIASAGLGNILLQSGKPAEALPYYKKAIEYIESTRSFLQSEELRTSFFEHTRQTYAGIILANIRAKNFEESFNYNERARSRSFLDILGSKVQLTRSGTMLERELALQTRISVLQAMMEEEEADSSQTPDLRKDLSEAQQAYDEYLAKIRKENKEQASLMNVEPLTLKQVQEFLDPGVTMLEYFVARGAVWLWVVEKNRLRFVRISIARTDLVSKVTALRNGIYQVGNQEKFIAFSRELYKLLIEPALPLIRGKELIIVPHDVLHYLPFQALLASDSRYLIEKYPMYYLSSASLMQFIKEKRRAPGEKVLAVGNPDLGDPKMSLRFAEIEAKEIQMLYPQSTVLLGKEAKEEKVKALSPQNDVIHFATHAQLNEHDPLSSAILLAKGGIEDGRLEVREIFGMDLHANLVVLSACETGLGKVSSGDELVGLTRAFIYAGTPSIVASLWNVDDSSTAALMASFYKNLKTMTKVEALRQAQLELINGQASSVLLARRRNDGVGKLGETPSSTLPAPSSISVSTSHPYFWAPFILVGDGK